MARERHNNELVRLGIVPVGAEVIVVPSTDKRYSACVIGKSLTPQYGNPSITVSNTQTDFPFTLAGGTKVRVLKWF